MEAYGLDLCGISAERSPLVRAIWDHATEDITIQELGYLPKHHQKELGNEIGFEDAQFIARVVDPSISTILVVDAPLDVRELVLNLSRAANGDLKRDLSYDSFVRREIDLVLGALPPLFEKLGSVTLRLQLLRNHLNYLAPNIRIFETYPAGVLRLISKNANRSREAVQYKNAVAEYSRHGWGPIEGPVLTSVFEEGTIPPRRDRSRAVKILCDRLLELKVQTAEGMKLTDDHMDSVICAVVGLAKSLKTSVIDNVWDINEAQAETLKWRGTNKICMPEDYLLVDKVFWNRINIDSDFL